MWPNGKKKRSRWSGRCQASVRDVGIAACAETGYATLQEEGAKTDIKLCFPHALKPDKLVYVHAQVKSGNSYRSKRSNATTLVLANITKATREALAPAIPPGILVWVPTSPKDRVYWYAGDPRRKWKTPLKLSWNQYVRPSIRYDLTRLRIYASSPTLYSDQCERRTVAPAVASADIRQVAWKRTRPLGKRAAIIGYSEESL